MPACYVPRHRAPRHRIRRRVMRFMSVGPLTARKARRGPSTVLLVDDHAEVRRGLQMLLELDGSFRVVAEACTAAEAVARAREARPDIVIMDVRLSDASGIDACRVIRTFLPATRVIMLTSYPDEEAMTASVLAGASGYVLKELSDDSLRRALHIVAQGGSLLQPDVVNRVVSRRLWGQQPAAGYEPDPFSEDEWRILSLIAGGQTNREIGATLHLSENTVRNCVSRILDKLGCSRRTEIAAYMARRGQKG